MQALKVHEAASASFRSQASSPSERNRFIHKTTLVFLFLVLQMAIASAIAVLFLDTGTARELPSRIQGSFVRLIVGNDSWKPMDIAYQEVAAHPDKNVYTKVFFEDRLKFHYPPTALLYNAAVEAFHPLASSVPRYWFYFRTSAALSYLALAGIALAVFAILRHRLRMPAGVSPFMQKAIPALLALTLCGVFFPVMHGFLLGQIQIFLDAFFCVILFCFLRNSHQKTSGVLLGLMSLVKPQFGLLVLWGILRKRWQFAGSAILCGTAALAISVGIFGWRSHTGYIDVIRHVGSRGEAFIRNQSVNGLLNRFYENGDAYKYDPDAYAPIHPVVGTVTMLSSLALIASAAWLTWRRREQAPSAYEVSFWVIAATLASPIALDQHFGVAVAVFAVLLADVLNGDLRKGQVAMAAASFVLIGNLFPPRPDQLTPWMSLIHSEVFYGALLLLILLYRAKPEVSSVPVGPKIQTASV